MDTKCCECADGVIFKTIENIMKDGFPLTEASRMTACPCSCHKEVSIDDMEWIIKEVKRLRSAVDTVSKQANGMIIIDDSEEIDKLKEENAKLRNEVKYAEELGHANVHWKDKEIEKLEKENTKLREINKNLMRNIGRND